MIEFFMALYLTLFSNTFLCRDGKCYMVVNYCQEPHEIMRIEHFSCSIYSNLGGRKYEVGDYVPIKAFTVREAWEINKEDE